MSLINLKRIACYRFRRDVISDNEIVDFLKSWWSGKYNRPDNDPLLLDKRLEELIVEYYEDFFKLNPEKLNEFEMSIKELPNDSDENWFKQIMKDEYTPESAFSTEFKNKNTPESKDEEFEESYHTLGAGVLNGKQHN